jgi:hypothetical protein
MPSHQERIRAKNPEMNCKHYFMFRASSDVAPFILENGDRKTIRICFNCGLQESYIRSQEEFLKEIDLKSCDGPEWDKKTADLSHLKQDIKDLLK